MKIYKSVVLCLVLYGCETLSLTLKEKHEGVCEEGAEGLIWTMHFGDQIKEHKTGEMWNMWGGKKCIQDFKWKGETTWETYIQVED
jgi:hypothetical protein